MREAERMSRFEAEKKLSVKEQAASELAAELATMRARFTSQYHLNSDFLFYEANLKIILFLFRVSISQLFPK